MKTIFGIKGLALTEYAIAANAILGIRDSGKTYSATEASEELYEASIPFIWLDPIGVAHNLRIPGKGRGYPVVVAGGKHGDLPLTVKSVGAIVRAAMKSNISLVLDLFSVDLTKADWRRIVKETCEILLHENAEHGLRHVFIEEAAEFVPQRIQDNQTFSAVEKLVRMGGNSKVGITLINQRSADLNKSVLELCANVFVHRQRGKNTLQDLKKWLSMTDPDTEKKITASLPDLKSGQCWVMSNDLKTPVLVQVPQKNSLHPDRRAAPISSMDLHKHKPVPADDFVAQMKAALAPKEKTAPESLPHRSVEATKQYDQKAFDNGKLEGYGQGHALGWTLGYRAGYGPGFEAGHALALEQMRGSLERAIPTKPYVEVPAAPAAPDQISPSKRATSPSKPRLVAVGAPVTVRAPAGDISKPQAKILESLAWWARLGHETPTRVQVGIKAKMKARGGHFKTRVSELSTAGLVSYPDADRLQLTAAGKAVAPTPQASERVLDALREVLTAPQMAILGAMLLGYTERTRIAAEANMDAAGGHFKTRLSELSSMGLIAYPDKGSATLQPWVKE